MPFLSPRHSGRRARGEARGRRKKKTLFPFNPPRSLPLLTTAVSFLFEVTQECRHYHHHHCCCHHRRRRRHHHRDPSKSHHNTAHHFFHPCCQRRLQSVIHDCLRIRMSPMSLIFRLVSLLAPPPPNLLLLLFLLLLP